MKTLILHPGSFAGQTANSTANAASFASKHVRLFQIAALSIALVLSIRFVSAQKSSTLMLLPLRAGNKNYLQKPDTRNTGQHFFATRFPEVFNTVSVPGTINPNSFFKGLLSPVKQAGFGLLGDIVGLTKVLFFIPVGSGGLKANLSIKRYGIAIEPKGPANFHYAAIDLKMNF